MREFREGDALINDFDMLVIGSGPGGQRAAIQAAKLGKRVAIVERREIVGGVTAHTGTIPSKTLREAVLYLCGWRERNLYGRSYRVKSHITAADLMQRLHLTIRQQIEIVHHQLVRNGVTVLTGAASFVDPHTLRLVDAAGHESRHRAGVVVVATGTVPHRPPEIPFDDRTIIDSDGILTIDSIPRSMTVIGAGIIGVEYATIFSALDTKVTLIDSRGTILEFVDADVVDAFRHDLQDRGIALRLGESVERVEKQADGRAVTYLKGGRRVASDMVMVAAGRVGATATLSLLNAGLQADDRGRLRVDEHLRTAVPHIYAVGDVIGFPALASTSAEQGRKAACHAFGVHADLTPELFPLGIYAVPEISICGRTEQQLRKDGVRYESGVAHFRETARGQIQGGTEGMLKLLFELDSHKLLGVHIVGEGATELIHIGQAVMAHDGGLTYFLNSVFNYPTLAEAYKTAALDAWNRLA
jgi:NAD(P) transhydrogenase